MGTAPSISRRALAAALAPALSALLPGCGRAEEKGGAMRVSSSEDALDVTLAMLKGQYGRVFRLVSREKQHSDTVMGTVSHRFLLTPEGEGDSLFTSSLTVSALDGAVQGRPRTDYSQYLFKERAERDFRRVTSSLDGVSGWAVNLTYVRQDSRTWRKEDYGSYMGAGLPGNPMIRVTLLLPRGMSSDEYAEISSVCFRRLYRLNRSMDVIVGVEGSDPYREPLTGGDVDTLYPATRKEEAIGKDALKRWVDEAVAQYDFVTVWDGNGNPDGKPQDPGSVESYPTVHWNPGHGPSAWK